VALSVELWMLIRRETVAREEMTGRLPPGPEG
jgi:hypothetical protein